MKAVSIFNKIIKWIFIALLGLVSLLALALLIFTSLHHRYGMYPSGGVLTKNQAMYDVIYYGINLKVRSQDKSLAGHAVVQLKSLVPYLDKVELNLIDNFNVSEVLLKSGQPLRFIHNDDRLWILFDEHFTKDDLIEFSVYYKGHPPIAIFPPWIGGFNWSEDSTGNDWIGLSCQGEGAKIWFPCKDHPSDEPDSAAINITVPDEYYCASNGLLRKISVPQEGFQTYHWFTKYPINNYNLTVNIARYELVKRNYFRENGKIMPVIYYVLPQNLDKADELIDMAVDMLKTYRKFYGEYPFAEEKFGLAETDYLGMEHQTINSYGNKYRFTRVDSVQFDGLMLHEMGHEWWGNKVTAKDWADMWIQEGICTYGEALYQLDKFGEDAYHRKMEEIRKRIRNKNPVIPKRNANTIEVYHPDIYTKGAFLMHSLRFILGDPVFYKTLMEFATNPEYTYLNLVTTDDFIELVNRNSGTNLRPFIEMFLYTTRLPEVRVQSEGASQYRIQIPNINFTIPMEVTTNDGTKSMALGPQAVTVTSDSLPVVDGKNWYFKKVMVLKGED